LVISAKEGVVEAIIKLVGSDITNANLWTADGSNHKSIGNFTLFEVVKSAIDGANQPSTNDMLEQLLEIINHSFDFCKRISINMELMQSNAAQMATCGIVIGIPQLTLTLLANIKTATKSGYGHEFCLAMHTIRKKYMYNHVHDATLLQFILKELAGANGVRVLKDAPALGTGTTHLVAKSVSYLQAMMGEDTNSAYTKSAYRVSSDSDLSEDKRKPCARKRKTSQCSKLQGGRGKQKKEKDDKPKKNTCPHCKSSIARSPIELNQTSACGTRRTRSTASNLSATSLR
jgi:hypothetical protein